MKRVFALIFTTLLASSQVFADWDPELEAQEQVEREAAQRAEQEKQREMDRMRSEAEAKANKQIIDSRRKTLGAAANGKSDAEVNRLYELKIKETTEAANRAVQEGRNALSHGQGAEAVKNVTGKTLQELENMSDEEAEALSRQLEMKYGQ